MDIQLVSIFYADLNARDGLFHGRFQCWVSQSVQIKNKIKIKQFVKLPMAVKGKGQPILYYVHV